MNTGKSKDGCEIRPLGGMRSIILELLNEARAVHHVHGIMQIDITAPRKRMREIETEQGGAPSLTAYIVSSLARALEENKIVHAYRKGKKIYIFDDVDVSTVVERDNDDGEPVPTSLIVRKANTKTLKTIHNEIRDAQVAELVGSALGNSEEAKRSNQLIKLPSLLRKILWWKLRNDPIFKKANMGTVNVSSIGMFTGAGDTLSAIPLGPWSLMMTVGSISKRQWIHEDGKVSELEMLNLTLSVDHAVVDGGPAARFLARFKQLLEDGYGLDSFD